MQIQVNEDKDLVLTTRAPETTKITTVKPTTKASQKGTATAKSRGATATATATAKATATATATATPKPKLPCHQTPIPIIPGLIPHTKCQLQKSFYKAKLEAVPFIDNKKHIVASEYLTYFPPYELAHNPQAELDACTLRTYNCQTFDQTESTWNLIDEDTYKKNVCQKELHSSNITSETVLESSSCKINGEFSMKLIIKDQNSAPKSYGGDFITARLVEENYPKYYETKSNKHGIYDLPEYEKYLKEDATHLTFEGTVIPGHVLDNKDGTYDIKIPCKVEGNFRIQIFIMRKSEMMTALVHSFKTLHNKGGTKNRFLNAQFENGDFSSFCDPVLPDMLPGGDLKKVCPIFTKLSKEWYCERPFQGNCDSNGKMLRIGPTFPDGVRIPKEHMPGTWTLGKIIEDCGLQEVHEDLVFERAVEVLPISSSSQKESKSHQQIAGYFHNGEWHDRILPNWAKSVHNDKHHLFKDKRIVRMGCSVLRQMVSFLFVDIKALLEREEAQDGSEEKNSRKRRSTLLHNGHLGDDHEIVQQDLNPRSRSKRAHFKQLPLDLQDQYPEDCPPDEPMRISVPDEHLNLTQYYFNHGLPYFMGTKPHCSGKALFTPEIFERMIEHKWFGKEWIVFMDHSAHFANWHPIILYNRLIAVKEAATKYKKLSPETPVIFKTFNYVRGPYANTYGITSGAVPLWQRDMVFKIFGNPYLDDMSDDEKFPVKVLDVYPMSLSIFDHLELGNVHPLELMARESGNMALNLLYKMGYFS